MPRPTGRQPGAQWGRAGEAPAPCWAGLLAGVDSRPRGPRRHRAAEQSSGRKEQTAKLKTHILISCTLDVILAIFITASAGLAPAWCLLHPDGEAHQGNAARGCSVGDRSPPHLTGPRLVSPGTAGWWSLVVQGSVSLLISTPPGTTAGLFWLLPLPASQQGL